MTEAVIVSTARTASRRPREGGDPATLLLDATTRGSRIRGNDEQQIFQESA